MELLPKKVCLITGASRGIGLAIAKRFAEEGAIVYANVREPKNLDDYYARISEKSRGLISSVYFDVRDESAVKQAVQRIKHEHGRLDVLVNNAGIMKDALIGMISPAIMQEIYETNVRGGGNAYSTCVKAYD